METRKIIAFGKSSYVLSLPREWMDKHKLAKGDIIYVAEELDRLTLSPASIKSEKEPIELKITTDGKSIDHIKREIISSYINNVNVLYISGSDIRKKSKEIRHILHGLVALEIMQESSDKIIAKDFLNMKDISVVNLIRKIDIIVRSMFIDSKEILAGKESEDIDQRDDDVNRLVFLVFRTVKAYLSDLSLMKNMKMELNELLYAWNFTFNLEKSADFIKRLSRIFLKTQLTKQQKADLISIFSKIEKNYLDTMKAFYNKDRELAFNVSDERKEIMNSIDELFEKLGEKDHLVFDMVSQLKSLMSTVHALTRICYG